MTTSLILLSLVTAPCPMDRDRVVATDAALRQLARMVMEFRKVCGRLPTAGEGLDVLVHQPSDWPAQIPWTPFLETSEIPCDGWGHEFVYVLDPELAEGFGVYSCGQDGVSSSEGDDRDDLNTWRRGRLWFGYYEHWVSRIDLQSGVIGLGIILLAAAAGMVLRKKALGNDPVA
jgi:hypothetical protein